MSAVLNESENRTSANRLFWVLVSIGSLLRLVLWSSIPEGEFGDYSDEISYYASGMQLALGGQQDMYWPPLTGWIIAFLATATGSKSVALFRLFWIVMDVCNMLLLRTLSQRVSRSSPAELGHDRTWSLSNVVTAGYALYLPAACFSIVTTSETPALLLILAMLVLSGGGQGLSLRRIALSGVCAGLATLARTNLAAVIPAIALVLVCCSPGGSSPKTRGMRGLLFAACSVVVVLAFVARNYVHTGRVVLTESAYTNLYYGNSEVYQQDLDLFSPFASDAQAEQRKNLVGNTTRATRQIETGGGSAGRPSVEEYAEMRSAALSFIRRNPGLIAKRAVGRLARVFCPKTSQWVAVGRGTSIKDPTKLGLLAVANIQFGLLLVLGFAGLFSVKRFGAHLQPQFVAVLIGVVTLCLVAISSPRYSFHLEPILLICSVAFVVDAKSNWRFLMSAWRRRWGYFSVMAFLAWAWVAAAAWAFSPNMREFL